MRYRILANLAAVLAGVLCLLGDGIGNAAQVPPDLVKFESERARMAFELSEPIATCVAKHDTSNPAFHGCIDWHSSVHGTWALTAYTWATKDERYRPLIESILQPSLLDDERKHLAKNPDFEMPYGRAWFLRLVIDYRKAFGKDILDAFGDDVATSLVAYYTKLPPDPMSIAYQSSTWALINLYDYGISRHDAHIIDFVKEKVRTYYLKDDACPIKSAEVETGEFMAVCTNWAWLVQKVLPRDEFIVWLNHFLPPDLSIDPITKPAGIHQVGLNFSRGWGLWNLYWGTDNSRFLTAYLRHFNQTYSDAALWKGDYHTVSHWVAQFGMLDLILTYYDDP
jgi:hypothetical protein